MSDHGYITDVEYTKEFYGHLAPLSMNYVAAINGVRPRPTDAEFAWCELGCGMGVSAVALAAMHPRGRFYASDMNPAHTRFAQDLADAGDVNNLTLLTNTFGEMLEMDLPGFDFVTLHGVWSWVPEQVRNDILAFLKRFLKPGGLVMVSYNAMPGWSLVLPLRQMMQEYAATLQGDSLTRAREALNYLKFLRDGRATYFVVNPAAGEVLDELVRDKDIRYVAHEYLTQHGDAFYFGQVERAMTGIGLEYVGNMFSHRNYAQLMAPPRFHELLNGAPSRSNLETRADFIANTRFRNDLYVSGNTPRTSVADDPTLFASTLFGLTQVPERIELKGSEMGLGFDLTPEAARVGAIFRVLAEGPATIQELHARAEPSRSLRDTIGFLSNLVVFGLIVPVSRQAPPVRGWSKLNSVLTEQGLRAARANVWLACPALGTAIPFNLPYAVAVRAALECGSANDAGDQASATLARHGSKVILADGNAQRAASDAEARSYFADLCARLRDPASAEGRHLRLLGLA